MNWIRLSQATLRHLLAAALNTVIHNKLGCPDDLCTGETAGQCLIKQLDTGHSLVWPCLTSVPQWSAVVSTWRACRTGQLHATHRISECHTGSDRTAIRWINLPSYEKFFTLQKTVRSKLTDYANVIAPRNKNKGLSTHLYALSRI